MSNLPKKIARGLVHVVADPRKFYYRQVATFANSIHNKKILELGSGYAVRGKYYYSAKRLFPEDNEFIQSDINKSFGHPIVDVTKMKYSNEFDVILCLNVLEHVYDYQKALKNMYKALKKNGRVIIAVPFNYPLHDEPGDYWRFTEHALKNLLKDNGFKLVSLKHKGKREYPFGYYLEAKK